MLKRKIKANKRRERIRQRREEQSPENKMKGFRKLIGLTDSKIQEQADELREKYLEERGLSATAINLDGADGFFSDDSFEFADDYQYMDKKTLGYLGSDDGVNDENYDKKSRKSKKYDLVSEDIFEKEHYDDDYNDNNMLLIEPGDIEMDRGMNSYDKFR